MLLWLALLAGTVPPPELERTTSEAWQRYVTFTEARVEAELEASDGFLMADFFEPSERAECQRRVAAGEVCVVKRETLDDEGKSVDVPSGMIHHWYGAVFVPGATVARVVDFAKRYDESHELYPEVEDSRLLTQQGEVFEIFLRLRRKKIITVHYNTDHEVTYREISDTRWSSRSLATRINEIANPGKDNESEKAFGDDRGFLWGLNSYWRFEQTEEGTMVECETVSLSRSVPAAARWLVKSYIDSVPRESLESTLAPLREHLAR